ncbi:hypothetical protein CI610_02611 [invertebrate metagenome]|uniref:Uncharacterized protein n=1 Tax=invertebrate metagenome TaxID=1711999 RepID=A0A2H9T5F0_9ZZZZ
MLFFSTKWWISVLAVLLLSVAYGGRLAINDENNSPDKERAESNDSQGSDIQVITVKTTTINDLPNKMFCYLAHYFTPKSFLLFGLTNKYYKKILLDNISLFTFMLSKHYYGSSKEERQRYLQRLNKSSSIPEIPDASFVTDRLQRLAYLRYLSNKNGFSCKCVTVLKGHSNWVGPIIQLADKHLVSGSDDGTLIVWDMEKFEGGQCVAILNENCGAVLVIIQLTDNRLVSGHKNGALIIWNLNHSEGSRCTAILKECDSEVNAIGQLTDIRLLSCYCNGTLIEWNLESGTIIYSIKITETVQSFVCLNQNCVLLACHSCLIVWDICQHKEGQEHEHIFNELRSSHPVIKLADNNIVSGDNDGNFLVWKWGSFDKCTVLGKHRDLIRSVIQLDDGRFVSITSDGEMKIWDLHTRVACRDTLSIGNIHDDVRSIIQLHDGRLVLTSYGGLIVLALSPKDINSEKL